jgi:hypothetical protein
MSQSASALKEIFKRFEQKNNPEKRTHNDNVIDRYSLLVTDKTETEFRAIPVILIDSFIREYKSTI